MDAAHPMYAILLLAFVLITYAVGDLIAVKTKSIISMMFTCSVVFIVGFWLGVPQTLFTDSQLAGIGGLLITSLLVHMGTLMSLEQLKEQWKTVLIAVAAVIGITILIIILGPMLLGREKALIAAPVISGGVIAALTMQEAVKVAGLPSMDALMVYATVLMVMEGFIGYPVASFCLKKEGMVVKKKILDGTYQAHEAVKAAAAPAKKKLFPPLPDEYNTEYVLLGKTVLIALLASFLSYLIAEAAGRTIIDKNIMSLLMGILFSELGFLDSNILTKSNSNGLAMAALMAVIFMSLSKATPQILLELLPAIIIAQVIGVAGYAIFAVLAGKFLGISPWMCIAIGSTANYGFPGTYVISNEVARTLGDTPEMREQILGAIMPKMLVAGFITVSIASVFIAGIVAQMI